MYNYYKDYATVYKFTGLINIKQISGIFCLNNIYLINILCYKNIGMRHVQYTNIIIFLLIIY